MAFNAPQLPPYGYCESYFVENQDDDNGQYARAAADRERARAVAKLRQRELADELSRATADEYQEDVLDHMERMEMETMPDIQSIEIQTEIQWFMRPYLLDFLLEAHHAFGLLPETLHLAVNLLDRYCSRRVVYKRHYQLVGCAALLIAAKYGDRKERVPTIRELKSMCCSLYDDDMFTQMEWHVLQTLNWVIGHPTVSGFLELALTEITSDPELEHMTWYITELGLYHKEFIPVRPSIMARSALALARYILSRPQPRYSDWSARYDPQVAMNLSTFLGQPSQALMRKFASPHLSSVSTTIEMFLQRQAILSQRQQHAQAASSNMHRMDMDPAATSTEYLNPQTPQKGTYSLAPVGVLTPPITPDKSYCAVSGYPAAQNVLPCAGLTPPSSVTHGHTLYTEPTSHYIHMHQPQFVQ